MKHFVTYILCLVLLFMVMLEATTRLFHLSSDVIPEANIGNNKLYLPHSEGIWIKGGRREITSHYKINAQGFNSLKDYNSRPDDKLNIAIIGDSYIEGFHVDVENSIGRQLEQLTQQTVEVHEYGKSSGNIVDYVQLFKQYTAQKYDYTFILLTDPDLAFYEAAFMGKGNTVTKSTSFKNVYTHFASIRYLNSNLMLNKKLQQLFRSVNPFKKSNASTDSNLNIDALQAFDSSCVILYEPQRLDIDRIQNSLTIPSIPIKHQYIPDHEPFDYHWNTNGRHNCALTIKTYLESIDAFKKAPSMSTITK